MLDEPRPLINRLHSSVNIVHSPKTGWIVLAVSIVVTFFAYWFASNQVEVRAQERFTFRVKEISDAIHERLSVYEQALNGGVGLFNASQDVNRHEWQAYVESLHLSERLPGIQGMGFAVPVSPENKAQFIADIRAQGFPEFNIQPGGEREAYSSIVYLEPFDWRNQRAFGYDMWSNTMRREAMARARDNAEAATSGIITLVQETEKDVQRGFLTYLPVYNTVKVPETIEERRQQFYGWVYAAFRAGDLMRGILGASDRDIAFEIYDGEVLTEDALLFDSDKTLSLLNANSSSLFSIQVSLVLQGRPWTIFFNVPYQNAYQGEHSNQPLFILIAGIIVDTLLFYVIVSLHLINRHIQKSELDMRNKFALNEQNLAHQARLVEAKEKESETFFELAPEAFLVVSSDGTIVKANHSAHKLFKFELGTLCGVNVDSLVPSTERARHASLRNGYSNNPTSRIMGSSRTLEALSHDGESFPALINLVPIEYRGEIHTVAAIHDVSVQKHVEQTLADAKEKAESASRSKSEFVANMSHEIRTPLNAVLGAAQLLGQTDPNSIQRKYIQMIRSSGEALLGVINDILDFSKIEAGYLELTPISFDLHEILNRVALMMSVNAGEKAIELVIDLDPDVNNQIVGDPLRIQQVLINLVSNAIKFTDQGSVVLNITLREQVNSSSQLLRFAVTDSGIGMNEEQKKRLFKAFSQADGSITRRFGGTGLGLVISNKILDIMGTKIHVDSELGRGSVFYFDALIEGVRRDNDDTLTVRKQKNSILVLEGNAETISSIKHIVSDWGWRLCVATSLESLKQIDSDEIQQCNFALFNQELLYRDSESIFSILEEQGLPSQCAKVLMVGNNHQIELAINENNSLLKTHLVKPIVSSTLLHALDEAAVVARTKPLLNVSRKGTQKNFKFNGVKALLVEDNMFNQTIAKGLLDDMGVDIDIADNGQEAIDCVDASPNLYDLILMDIQMPVMDGVTATHIIRNGKKYKGPIVAMTAGVLQSEQQRYKSVGMDEIVPKPIDRAELFRAIAKVLPNYESKLASSDTPSATAQEKVRSAPESGVMDQAGLKAFNGERLQQLTRGKPERIQSIIVSLKAIERSAEESLSAAVKALQCSNYDDAHFHYHSVKGVVSNYGAEQLAHLIKTMEGQLRAQRGYAELIDEIDQIQNAYQAFIAASQNWIEEQEQSIRAQLSASDNNNTDP